MKQWAFGLQLDKSKPPRVAVLRVGHATKRPCGETRLVIAWKLRQI
jgi:hypothetical protein